MAEITKSQHEHNLYIHKLGMQLLQMKLRDTEDTKADKEALKKRHSRVARLLRKKIKVLDLEDGGLSVSLDQDWDTTSWTKDMIEAACEALVTIFMTPDYSADPDRKDRAIVMLEKLLYRHPEAEAYLRSCMESMVKKSANRLLRNGTSGALLDLLHVLHAGKERFAIELAKFGFSALFHEMLLLESKLAAILIQHSWRAHRKRQTSRMPKKLGEDFGTDLEMKMLRVGYVSARGFSLRMAWRTMHWFQTSQSKLKPGGFRGPIHMRSNYVLLGLNIILTLVSEKGQEYASANREDVVRSNGCIILAGFLSSPSGPYAELAGLILSQVAKAGESLCTTLHAGCVKACVRLLLHNRAIEESIEAVHRAKTAPYSAVRSKILPKTKPAADEVGVAVLAHAVSTEERERFRKSFIDCMQFVTRLATHAAGIMRARGLYGFIRPHRGDSERINYLELLQRFGEQVNERFIREMLGQAELMQEITSALVRTHDIPTMRNILAAVLALACSECYKCILTTLVKTASMGVLRLVDLLEEPDQVLCVTSMCILNQLATYAEARVALIEGGIAQQLHSLSLSTAHYGRPAYQRAVYITATLCRQEEWRSYDPEIMPDFFGQVDIVRLSVYMDLLRTMTRPPLEIADDLSMADLAVMPIDESATLQMSKCAADVGAKALADFFSHPDDDKFFISLPWEESVGACVVLRGLSMHAPTVHKMFSQGLVYFLGQCVFVSRFLFLGAPLSEPKMVLVLNGVAAASLALYNICMSSIGHKDEMEAVVTVFLQSDLASASVFFINTLCTTHPTLDMKMKALQTSVGTSVVKLFDGFARLLLSWNGPKRNELLLQLSAAGEAATRAIKLIPTVFGKAARAPEVLEVLCSLVTNLTTPMSGADTAFNVWEITSALRVHLPAPLSGMPFQSPDNELYRQGLGRLSTSYFKVCANLGQIQKGRIALMTEGYLRRAIEKLTILQPVLDSDDAKEHLKTVRAALNSPKLHSSAPPVLPVSVSRQEVAACLHCIAAAANCSTAKEGASNLLILSDMYSVVSICARMLRTIECHRSDPSITYAVAVLAALSMDMMQAYSQYEAIDIVDLMNAQLHEFVEFPLDALRDVVLTIKNVAAGFRSEYLAQSLHVLREPLGKVARLRSDLTDLVRDTQWEISKAIRANEQVKKNAADFEDSFLMEPHAHAHAHGQTHSKNRSLQPGSHQASYALEGGATGKFSSSGSSSSGAASHPHSDAGHTGSPGLAAPNSASLGPGSSSERAPSTLLHIPHYGPCGPSTCGSLRFPDFPTAHGLYAGMSDQETRIKSMSLPVAEGGVLSLSREDVPPVEVGGGPKFVRQLQYTRDKTLYSALKFEIYNAKRLTTSGADQALGSADIGFCGLNETAGAGITVRSTSSSSAAAKLGAQSHTFSAPPESALHEMLKFPPVLGVASVPVLESTTHSDLRSAYSPIRTGAKSADGHDGIVLKNDQSPPSILHTFPSSSSSSASLSSSSTLTAGGHKHTHSHPHSHSQSHAANANANAHGKKGSRRRGGGGGSAVSKSSNESLSSGSIISIMAVTTDELPELTMTRPPNSMRPPSISKSIHFV